MKGINTNKRIVAVIYAMMIMLVTTTVAIGVYDFNIKTGTITVEDKSEEIKSKEATVGELLKEQDITIESDDYINVSEESQLESDFDIVIKRAVPVVLNFKEKEININTAEDTVADVLNSLSIFYDEDDKIEPALDTKVAKDMKISLTEVEIKENVVEEEIDFETETVKNGQLEKGKTLVEQEGIKGIRENKVNEIYENGELLEKKVTETKLVREPVKQIIQEGTKEIPVETPSRGDNDTQASKDKEQPKQETSNPDKPEQVKPVEKPAEPVANAGGNGNVPAGARSMVMNASAYDLSYASTGKRPGDPYYGITASGTQARPGVVAVDPSVIPLGTKLYIESMDGTGSYGYASAEDKGGAIKGNRIDLFYSNRSDAMKFGRRQVKVYILD